MNDIFMYTCQCEGFQMDNGFLLKEVAVIQRCPLTRFHCNSSCSHAGSAGQRRRQRLYTPVGQAVQLKTVFS